MYKYNKLYFIYLLLVLFNYLFIYLLSSPGMAAFLLEIPEGSHHIYMYTHIHVYIYTYT